MDGTQPLQIEYRPIGDLIPYARNARTHDEAQVALIAGSIREFGFTNPVLVDGANGIIAGHGRVMAARKLGLVQVPVIELGHLSEAQKRAYVLADNKLAERAGWDLEMLALEVGDLQSLGIDMADLGFTGRELDDLLRGDIVDPREDEVPPLPEVPVSRLGDLWCLGPHRLICGDATVATTVDRLNGTVRPHLMVTDPPYGVSYDPDWRTLRDSGVHFLAVDMPEANDLTVGIMALVAQAEREAISRRTKEALAVAKARGVKLGNPNGAAALRRAARGAVALRATVSANAAQHAADLADVVTDIRASGERSLREMAKALTARGIRTRRGGSWQVSNVRNLLGRLDAV